MFTYTGVQWIFFFFFYCLVGWVWETTYCSICDKHFENRGFMHGPYLPIYGSGAIVMLFVTIPVRGNYVLSYLFGMLAATLLEYVTGVVMEALFKVRYWDYSCQKFNFQGHICLKSSIAWGFFTLLLTYIIHQPVEKLCFMIPSDVLNRIVAFVAVIMAADFALSVKAAISLRDVLIKMEEAKKELELLQKRLDVTIAFYGDSASKMVQELGNRKDGLVESIEAKFEGVRNLSVVDTVKDGAGSVVHELEELREKFIVLRTKSEAYTEEKKLYLAYLFKNHPTMISEKYKETLEAVKKRVVRKS